jgi:hemolysin-activating ACP:hemolysin acyltransferase
MMWGKGKTKDAKAESVVNAAPAGNAAAAHQPAARTVTPPAEPAPPATDMAGKSMAAAAQHAQFAQLFSQAVAVLMRDPNYKNMPLHDLEFLLPPIIAGQCAVANARITENGPLVPVALALWAKVSTSVDKRLSENLDKPVSLTAGEWKSGTIPWMITLAGAQPALVGFVKQLCEKEFNGQNVKMRAADKDGKRSVQFLAAGKAHAP